MPLDTETKTLIDRLNTRLADMSKIEGAVKQLETEVRALPKQFSEKLASVRAVAWDDNGNYRGVFGRGTAGEEAARCFGLHVMAHVGGSTRALDALRGEMKSVYERALGDTQASGDSLVPTEYSARVQRLVESYGVFPRKAFRQPMSSNQLTFQRRTSGFTVYKLGRSLPATASELGFTTINLNADTWCVLCLYPKELGEDAAASIAELVALEMGQAFAYQIDDCAFVGDGTPADLDVVGITTRLIQINGVDDGGSLTIASGNAWSEIVEAEVLELIGSVPNYDGAQNEFYASNPFVWQVLHKLALSKGGVTRAEFQGEQRLMAFGYPINIVQTMLKSATNSTIPLLFGDLRLSSTHGVRKELMIEESRDVKFLERQVAVLGTQRHAISNHSLGSAADAGPVVGLIMAAS